MLKPSIKKYPLQYDMYNSISFLLKKIAFNKGILS